MPARPVNSSVSKPARTPVSSLLQICSVSESAVAPEPHDQTYVPGVTPRLANVAPV